MEMDAQFLFQVGAVVASLSGAWALVRAQVNTLKATQEEIKSAVDEVNRELDDAENNVAVLRQQIKVLSDILSPDNLAKENTRRGEVQEQIKSLQKDVLTLQHMHNGRVIILLIFLVRKPRTLEKHLRCSVFSEYL
jgi:chromosome segregation ATPase